MRDCDPIVDPRDAEPDEFGSVDTKISPEDPRLGLPQRARLKPVAVALAVAATMLCVGLAVAWSRRAQRPDIAEEPKRASIPRSSVVPEFLASAPEVPTPQPLEAKTSVPAAEAPPSWGRPPRVDRFRGDPARDRARQQEAELEEQARAAGVFFSTSSKVATPTDGADEAGRGGLPSPGGYEASAPALGGGAARESWDPNLQDHKNDFLRSPPRSPDYLRSSLQRPVSRYELKASAIIPITLISGLNSDLPGPVTAMVRERVYDTVTGEHLLIPQGTRLFGWYDSKVAFGQERVLLCWDRLLFPNGNSINLQCMPAGDLQGQAGLTDEVDHHLDRLMAAVGLSTLLAVGTQAIAGDPTGEQPTLAQTAARNASGQINSAGQAFVGRQLNIQPTITVRPGFAANLFVTKDLILEPYAETPN